MKISVILGIAFVSLALAGCGTTAKTTVNKVDGSLKQETIVQDNRALSVLLPLQDSRMKQNMQRVLFMIRKMTLSESRLFSVFYLEVCRFRVFLNLATASSIKRFVRLVKSRPNAAHIFGNMLIWVKPGMVLISFK